MKTCEVAGLSVEPRVRAFKLTECTGSIRGHHIRSIDGRAFTVTGACQVHTRWPATLQNAAFPQVGPGGIEFRQNAYRSAQ